MEQDKPSLLIGFLYFKYFDAAKETFLKKWHVLKTIIQFSSISISHLDSLILDSEIPPSLLILKLTTL